MKMGIRFSALRRGPAVLWGTIVCAGFICCGCNKPSAPVAETDNKTRKSVAEKNSPSGGNTAKTADSPDLPVGQGQVSRKTDQQAGQQKNGSSQSTSHTGLKPFHPPKMVRLDNITPDGLKEFLAKHKGQVILVDYWATWCQPCKATFPHSVKLAREHAADGLVVVSLCVDYAESRPQAISFLKQQNARLINFFPDEKLDPDTLAEAFDVKVFPTYRVYGADGKLVAEILPPENADPKQVPHLLAEKIDAAVRKALGL